MKNLFIPYELALEAKELGFNEFCIGEYTKHAQTNAIDLRYPKHEGLQGDWPLENEVDAPLYQQIIDWLREKHKIETVILSDTEYNNSFEYCLYKLHSKNKITGNINYTTYYEALNKAIEEALKLIERNSLSKFPIDENIDGSRI
jgi:hypothetical protein